ncbi:MAG: hypothetical protein ACK2UK_09955 [Candidatus Promineifilaceae bacterium]|jgi:hypothetical protein
MAGVKDSISTDLTDRRAAVGLLDQLAAAVGDAHLQAALAAYEDARMDGLCHDGAWEIALQAGHSAKPSLTSQNDK